MITKTEAEQPDMDKNPPKHIGEVIADKNKKTKNNWLNCLKCNKAYKKPDSLTKHLKTCTGKVATGRKAGVVSESKMVLNEQKKALQERIAKHADQLFNAQFNLAIGQTMLFVQTKERDSKGKLLRSYVERVESQETIKEYLEDENALNDDEHYYYITTRPANNQAIANLLDRAFGKPKENIELGEDPDAPLTPIEGGTAALRQQVRAVLLEATKAPTKTKGK
jgi:flagellar biosynthesis chaperone FliJ